MEEPITVRTFGEAACPSESMYELVLSRDVGEASRPDVPLLILIVTTFLFCVIFASLVGVLTADDAREEELSVPNRAAGDVVMEAPLSEVTLSRYGLLLPI
jgi:hypothetical protein